MSAVKEKMMVIKLGGSVLNHLHPTFFTQCIQLQQAGISPVIIHGGGPMISEWMIAMGKQPSFVDGRRVTDQETLSIVEMVLAGSVNKQIVSNFTKIGASAIGLSGIDLQMLQVKPKNPILGYVGEIVSINDKAIHYILQQGWIPVIASLGTDLNGQHYNVNADDVASAVAQAIDAQQLVMVSDVDGIRVGEKESDLLSEATSSMIDHYIKIGLITGGMIPKVRAGLSCLNGTVKEVVIVNGSRPYPLPRKSSLMTHGTHLIKEEGQRHDTFSHLSAT